MLVLRNLARISPNTVSCAITYEGRDREFLVSGTELQPGTWGIDYPPLPVGAPGARAFAGVLCSFFEGEKLTFPMQIESDWSEDVKAIPLSTPRWRYGYHCRGCGSEYDVFPVDIPVGPVPRNFDPGDYPGKIVRLACARCCLRVRAVERVDRASFDGWLKRFEKQLKDDEIAQYFAGLVRTDGGFVEFDCHSTECPRCRAVMSDDLVTRRCRHCGAEQVDLISSGPLRVDT